MEDGSLPVTPAATGTQPDAQFTGKKGPLARLLAKNALLTVLTLGIYRFWAKTWERRYFWQNARILGEPLEYRGLPSELFIGFLIVIAILAPIGFLYNVLSQAAMAVSQGTAVAVDILYYFVLFLLLQIGFYRMWRYRLTRTTWRGIRFGLDGSTKEFTVKALAWTIIATLTLGLASPWMRMALNKYRYDHTRFGSTHFQFEGQGRDLFGAFIIPYLISLVAFGSFLVGSIQMGLAVEAGGLSAGPQNAQDISPLMSLGFATMPFAYLALIWYRVREFRYVVSRLHFGEASFTSGLETGTIIVAAIITGIMFGVVGFGLLLIGGFAAGVLGGLLGQGATVLAVFLNVIAVLVALSVVTGVFFRHPLVERTCGTLTIANPAAFDDAVQSADRGPGRGEGLADAFDVGAF